MIQFHGLLSLESYKKVHMGGGSNELCIFLLGDSMNVILQVKNKTDGTNRKFEA